MPPIDVRPVLAVSALALFTALPALADPITVNYAGYRLETIGANTINIGAGGSVAGTPRTLFVAQLAPIAGTTATATLSGAASFGPFYNAPSNEWTRVVLNPTAADLGPVNVTFANGADSTTVVGRDLNGLTPIKLVTGITVDASVDPFGPKVNWTLPTETGDVDFVQLIFYNDDTNLEVGTRQTLAASATSFDLYGPGTSGELPLGYHLTIEVRLVDLFNDSLPLDTANIQRDSRAYINYTAPSVAAVPEPSTYATLAAGLVALGWVRRRKARA